MGVDENDTERSSSQGVRSKIELPNVMRDIPLRASNGDSTDPLQESSIFTLGEVMK